MKSLLKYFDIMITVIMCLILITTWSSRDTTTTTTSIDIGSSENQALIGFHNIEASDNGTLFRWGRKQVTIIFINKPLIYKTLLILSFHGTTASTQPVTVTFEERMTPKFTVQGGVFRRYHVLFNRSETDIPRPRATLSFKTTSAVVIKKQELGIALSRVTLTPLKVAVKYFAEPNYDVNYYFATFGTLFLAIALSLGVGRALMSHHKLSILVRATSTAVMTLLMYLTSDSPLSVLCGVLVVLCVFLIRPDLLHVSSSTLKVVLTKWPVVVVYLLFISIAITSLLVDKKTNICALNKYLCNNYDYNFMTGDEPTYTSVAMKLRYFGTAKINDKNTMHSLGVSFLLMPVITVVEENILWPRISFILLNGVIVSLLFHLSKKLSLSNAPPLTTLQHIGITTGAMVALPLIPAANQFYPDLIAGLLLMSIWYWAYRLTYNLPTPPLPYILASILLPWLHSKYLYISVVPIFIVCYIIWRQHNRSLLAVVISVYLLSLASVMWYGLIAWGNVFGPINRASLVLNTAGISRIFGLLFDQNQGVFWQNPLLFIGIIGIGMFYRRNPLLFVMWGWCFVVPIVFNAFHPNAYGGSSYSGRFQWSSAVMLYIPTIGMLVWMITRIPKLTTRILIGSLMLQSYFWYMYSTQTTLYNRSDPIVDPYSIMYGQLEPLFPQYYSLDVALKTPANYFWFAVMFIVALIINYRLRRE